LGFYLPAGVDHVFFSGRHKVPEVRVPQAGPGDKRKVKGGRVVIRIGEAMRVLKLGVDGANTPGPLVHHLEKRLSSTTYVLGDRPSGVVS